MIFVYMHTYIHAYIHKYIYIYTYVFNQIGTLDNLVMVSDELVKYDQSFESTAMKIVDILRNLLKGDIDQVEANLTVNDSKCVCIYYVCVCVGRNKKKE